MKRTTLSSGMHSGHKSKSAGLDSYKEFTKGHESFGKKASKAPMTHSGAGTLSGNSKSAVKNVKPKPY